MAGKLRETDEKQSNDSPNCSFLATVMYLYMQLQVTMFGLVNGLY